LKLEQEAKEIAISQEVQYAVFDAMKISDDDRKGLDAIVDPGEPLKTSTPQEEVAFERFSVEFERTYALIQRAAGKVADPRICQLKTGASRSRTSTSAP